MGINIGIDFTKYLPSPLRKYDIWVQFIQTVQKVYTDFFNAVINPIVDQYDIDLMTIEQHQNFLKFTGHPYSTYEGYTSTLPYFKKQSETIQERIQYKNFRYNYLSIYYVYNLIGDAFPMYFEDYLIPIYNWNSNNEKDAIIDTLDSGDDNVAFFQSYFSDGMQIPTIDDSNFPNVDEKFAVYLDPKNDNVGDGFLDDDTGKSTILDPSTILDKLTRNILLNYTYKQVENENDFLREETVRAFYNDTRISKRRTERLYYEPSIDIFHNSTQYDVETTEYENFVSGEVGAEQNTILLTSESFEPSAVVSIHFGNNKYSTLNSGIVDVQSLVQVSSGVLIQEDNYVRPFINPLQTQENFNEVAFYSQDSGILMYTTLPNVIYNDNMYGSFRFNFNEI
jgi:hypothetical protein